MVGVPRVRPAVNNVDPISEDAPVEFAIRFLEGDAGADVEITVSGFPTSSEFRVLNEQLSADPRFRPGLAFLVDATRLKTSGLSEAQMQTLSEPMLERDSRFPPAAVALVAADERAQDDLRLYRAHLGGSLSKREVFANRVDAVAWLSSVER